MLEVLLSPLTLAFVWLLGLLACWRRLSRAPRVLGVSAAAVLLLLCAPLGANLLVRWLETRISPADVCAPQDRADIVLLAGGYDRPPVDAGDYGALTQESWRRLHSAAELAKASPGARLWIAGGGFQPVKESRTLAQLAHAWDVPEQSIEVEDVSTTTWEAAFALRDRAPRHVRLVSSASHLPRAMIAFRAAGFQPCASPSHSAYLPARGPWALLPQASAVKKAADAMYELVGMLEYRRRRPDRP